MAAGGDYGNQPAYNWVAHLANGADVDDGGRPRQRGMPRVGKVVYRTDLDTLEVCIAETPDPTYDGGGTWITLGGAGRGYRNYTPTIQQGGFVTVLPSYARWRPLEPYGAGEATIATVHVEAFIAVQPGGSPTLGDSILVAAPAQSANSSLHAGTFWAYIGGDRYDGWLQVDNSGPGFYLETAFGELGSGDGILLDDGDYIAINATYEGWVVL